MIFYGDFMDIKNFVLSYYKNATKDFYISYITNPKEALKLHTHDYFQMYYVQHGNIIHHIKETEAKLSHGDVFIVPPNLPHYIEKKENEVAFYSVSFTSDFLLGIRESNKLIFDFLHYLSTTALESIQPKLTLPHEDIIFVETIFGRIKTEFDGEKTGKEEIIKECVSTLLSIFARVYFEEKAQLINVEYGKQAVMHCIEYIDNHFDEEISLGEIAHLSAMSKTCFCGLFRSITGASFHEYLNKKRIEHACEMILSGRKITTVASLCGYSDFSTFYRNFKKYMDVSPSRYAAERTNITKAKKV